MGKQELDNRIRIEVMDVILAALAEHYQTDVMPVNSSELTMPILDAENNEKFVNIHVSVPRGTRNEGRYIPYDGYSAAEDYAFTVEMNNNKKKARDEENRRKKEAKERKRVAKKTVKKLNKDGLDKMIHEGE